MIGNMERGIIERLLPLLVHGRVDQCLEKRRSGNTMLKGGSGIDRDPY